MNRPLDEGEQSAEILANNTGELKEYDLRVELYREYETVGLDDSTYRINHPQKLFIRPGGTTHRVLDALGIVHCIPFPFPGVVLRWKNRDSAKSPCEF